MTKAEKRMLKIEKKIKNDMKKFERMERRVGIDPSKYKVKVN